MIVKDSTGRRVYIKLYGSDADDIQIDEAYYDEPGCDEEVSDDEVEWIMNHYSDRIYEEWIQYQVMRAERYYEGDR
jgi:hypothetical protein